MKTELNAAASGEETVANGEGGASEGAKDGEGGPQEAEGSGGEAQGEGQEPSVKEEEVKSKVTVKSGQKEVMLEYLPLDLASFQSTTDFVRAFKEKGLPLHILINNAAIAWIPFSECIAVYLACSYCKWHCKVNMFC